MRKRTIVVSAALAAALVLAPAIGQLGASPAATPRTGASPTVATAEAAPAKGKVKVGKKTYRLSWAMTDAAKTFRSYLKKPRTLKMSELNGNEKYRFLGRTFPTTGQSTPATIKAGDVMLYQDNCVVVFYKTHANDGYSYTRIGRLTSTKGLARAVGTGSVKVRFSR